MSKKIQLDDENFASLLFLFNKNQQKYMNDALAEYGLNINQASFIVKMFYSKDYLCQDDLVESSYLSKSGVAKSLKDLEEKEYVLRERLDENKRKYVLLLSAKGEAMIPIIENINNDWEEKMGLNKVDKKFMRTFRSLTKKSIKLNK